MVKVSVIIPIYGVEKYLVEALDSVLAQTLTDIEIILIDDGSKDNCPQIIDEYAKKDNRIVAIHKKNGGEGQSCNVGLERATGEYVTILEPDDYIDKNMYEDLYNIAWQYNSDIVKSGFYDNLQAKTKNRIKQVEWDNDKIPQQKSFTAKECPLFLFYHPSIWSCIYKKEFLNKHNIRFIEAPGAGWTDNPFQVQTMCLAERINYTPKAYYYWRRLNENGADDLKDYKIPFERSKEIHKWLKENDIADENILTNLYKRELCYIKIACEIKKITNTEDLCKRIKELCEDMHSEMISDSKIFKNRDKRFYLLCKNFPKLVYRQAMFKSFRRNFISIRFNKKEKRIVLFGRQIFYKKGAYK